MTFDPDDPRLTAYALGELDTSEHAAIETMIDECPECRQAVEEIRKTVKWLSQQLKEEKESHFQPVGLNHQVVSGSFGTRRDAILEQYPLSHPKIRIPRLALGALAALLLIGLTISFRLSVPNAQKAVPHYATYAKTNVVLSAPSAPAVPNQGRSLTELRTRNSRSGILAPKPPVGSAAFSPDGLMVADNRASRGLSAGAMGGGMAGEDQFGRQRVAVKAEKGASIPFTDGIVHLRKGSLDQSANFYNRPVAGAAPVKNVDQAKPTVEDLRRSQVPALASASAAEPSSAASRSPKAGLSARPWNRVPRSNPPDWPRESEPNCRRASRWAANRSNLSDWPRKSDRQTSPWTSRKRRHWPSQPISKQRYRQPPQLSRGKPSPRSSKLNRGRRSPYKERHKLTPKPTPRSSTTHSNR